MRRGDGIGDDERDGLGGGFRNDVDGETGVGVDGLGVFIGFGREDPDDFAAGV